MPGAVTGSAFTYATPQGWRELPLTEMRAVRFQVGESAGDECTVSVLGGDGGGALANVNRWCGQIKAKAWTQAQLDGARRIEMFGAQALVVELGDEGGERRVLGALAKLDGRSVFVKLIGARDVVLAQRQAFDAFCTSLAKKP